MILTRRNFLAGAAAASVPGRVRPPNVLVFMTDQESALLPGPASRPNRARVAARGVEFTSVFCNTPQCSAARAALLTGLEPHRAGVITNVDGGSLGKPLSPALATVGGVFRSAGYSTGYFGKWHLGNQRQGLAAFGFDTAKDGSDEAVASQAAEWMRAQREPWLAWVSIVNPHDIYGLPRLLGSVKPRAGVRPPTSGLDNLNGKPVEQRQFVDQDQGRATREYRPEDWVRYRSHYLELVAKADACLGAALAGVKDLDSTVVVVTTDHGDALGEHGLPFKGPFMYEELIHIPLLISGPGEFSRPARRDDLVTQIDLAPTLAAMAGLEWPSKLPGVDLTRRRDVRGAVYLEYYSKQKWVNPIRTIRTRRAKLNWYDSGNKELYDLAADPHETRNLAGDREFAKLQAELERRLDLWRAPLTKR